MTSRERVFGAINRTGYDRIPVKHEGTPEVDHMIMDHFGIKNMEQLRLVVGDDFRYVEADYVGPELRKFPDGSIEGYWGERYKYAQFEGGKYLEPSYLPFKGIDSLDKLDRSHFPTADRFDYSQIKEKCKAWQKQYALVFGTPGDMDFINSIGRARGMEEVLMDLMDCNPVYLAIMDARFNFYYEMHQRVLQAAEGLIDITHVGEDLGNQIGPTINMDIFEKYFAPKYGKYFDMVHSYGAKTMMHMCGCVDKFLPRLIELGLDIYDVVQPTTQEMDIARLKEKYGDKLTFCGSMCVQSTLAWSTPQDVENEVMRRLKLFSKGGLILGPTHAIQAGSRIDNVVALYRTAGSLVQKIDDAILGVTSDEKEVDAINMSKLF